MPRCGNETVSGKLRWKVQFYACLPIQQSFNNQFFLAWCLLMECSINLLQTYPTNPNNLFNDIGLDAQISSDTDDVHDHDHHRALKDATWSTKANETMESSWKNPQKWFKNGSKMGQTLSFFPVSKLVLDKKVPNHRSLAHGSTQPPKNRWNSEVKALSSMACNCSWSGFLGSDMLNQNVSKTPCSYSNICQSLTKCEQNPLSFPVFIAVSHRRMLENRSINSVNSGGKWGAAHSYEIKKGLINDVAKKKLLSYWRHPNSWSSKSFVFLPSAWQETWYVSCSAKARQWSIWVYHHEVEE